MKDYLYFFTLLSSFPIQALKYSERAKLDGTAKTIQKLALFGDVGFVRCQLNSPLEHIIRYTFARFYLLFQYYDMHDFHGHLDCKVIVCVGGMMMM